LVPQATDEDEPEIDDYLLSLQSSQSSTSTYSTVPEEEISIWIDEIEEQTQKRQKLNEAVDNISGGRYSPVHSTLNTDWNDISDTQQRYYVRKVKETFSASLSVIAPRQEDLVWRALQGEPLFQDTSKRKRFDSSSGIVELLIKVYNQADSWQTKRQILSLSLRMISLEASYKIWCQVCPNGE